MEELRPLGGPGCRIETVLRGEPRGASAEGVNDGIETTIRSLQAHDLEGS